MHRELNDLKGMGVFTWASVDDIPANADMQPCGWALKGGGYDELRATIMMNDVASTRADQFYTCCASGMLRFRHALRLLQRA